MILYHKLAMEMVNEFEVINFEYLPREENQMAAGLATLGAMFQVNSKDEVQLIRMRIKKEPVHCLHIEEEVDGKPWYYDILQYVKDRQYPDYASENDKRILRRLAMGFLDGEVLYKKGKDQVLLRCVNSSKANKIVEEIHERVCGTHAIGHRMARQVMKVGYYWLTLENDCIKYTRKCHKCQIYSDKIHVPSTKLRVMAPP